MGSFFSFRIILFSLLYSAGHYAFFATDWFGREQAYDAFHAGAPPMERWESWALVGITFIFLLWRLWSENRNRLQIILTSVGFALCVTALHTFLAGAAGQWISDGEFLLGKQVLGIKARIILILFSSALAAWLSMFLMTGLLDYALHFGYEEEE